MTKWRPFHESIVYSHREKSYISFHCHGWVFNHNPKTSAWLNGIQDFLNPMHNVKFGEKQLQIRNRPLTDTKGGQVRASRCSFSGNDILGGGIKILKLTGNHSIICCRMAVMVSASWPLKMLHSCPFPSPRPHPPVGSI